MSTTRKITVSLPSDLVEFADRQAAQQHTSRSQIISEALALIRAGEEKRLAAEGYQFYAEESADFAAASAKASADAWMTSEETADDRTAG